MGEVRGRVNLEDVRRQMDFLTRYRVEPAIARRRLFNAIIGPEWGMEDSVVVSDDARISDQRLLDLRRIVSERVAAIDRVSGDQADLRAHVDTVELPLGDLAALLREVVEARRVIWGVVANAGRDTYPGDRYRWARVADAVGVGSTLARDLCRRHGFGPDDQV